MTTSRIRLEDTTARRRWRLIGAAVTVVALMVQLPAAAESSSVADDEQALLYELNLARWDPAAYQAATGIDLEGALPRPPLALNSQLAASAAFKANEMADHDYFDHRSRVTGVWPNELARDHGYPLPAALDDDANNIESLHAGSPVPFNVLGSFAQSAGHRRHLFGQGWFGTHTEIGVGRSQTSNYWAVHTAYRNETDTFVTGVVFDDRNGNGRMDPGEGIAGVTVTVGDRSTTTGAGGGYAVRAGAGRHQVKARGGNFEGISSARVTVTDYNVGVDFVSGRSEPVVRDYQLCQGHEPTILGTGGDDVITGTPGDDVIHGLGGRDVIDGRGGNDVICGGAGRDKIRGGGGRDHIDGGGGIDKLYGQRGNDVLHAGPLNGGRITDVPDLLKGGPGRDTCSAGSHQVPCD
jgi:hypothetical protein